MLTIGIAAAVFGEGKDLPADLRAVLAVEFRTIDGTGNNTFSPSQGAAGTRVIRFGYDADYPDGIGDVITEAGKPNPRHVSNAVMAQSSSILNDRGLSDWVVHWGQFLTHDMSLIDTGAAYNKLSTGAIGDFRIPITDPGDPLGPNPISFNRSAFDPTTGTGELMITPRGVIPIPRWQINSNTSYIDASNVYGSDRTTADALRAPGGKLATSSGGLLPMLDASNRFVAGDNRVNENVGLSSIHALFVREHNRIADRLKSYDPQLSDEEVYQWARKIVGAEMQAITYREFLPVLMGDGAPRAEDYLYDEGDASITTAFSTAAFRYGHSMQSPRIELVDNAGLKIGPISLGAATENPALLISDPAKVDLILKGLASQTAQQNDAYIVNGLRNINFGPPGAGGTDLAALDIQRGRDHGLINNYRQMRQVYSLTAVDDFAQLTSDVPLQAALEVVYGDPDKLDSWVAMIAEDHLPGSSLGSLAQHILASQFSRLRDSDRFFFSGDADLASEPVTAVIDFDTLTLSQIIRWNTGITRLQENVFFNVPEPTSCVWMMIVCGVASLGWRRQLARGIGVTRTLWVLVSLALTLGVGSSAQAHDEHGPGSNPLGCSIAAGESCYYAVIDDFHANPSTTDAMGEIFLALKADQSQLRYMIVLDDLLGLKQNVADRTEPDDIVGMHFHIHVPDTIGPHILNIFGLATPALYAEEDSDLIVDYEHHVFTGAYDNSDATIDPNSGQPYPPFFFATSKLLDNTRQYLDTGEFVVAVHTNESGFANFALHGHITRVVPEPASGVLCVFAAILAWASCCRMSRFAVRRAQIVARC